MNTPLVAIDDLVVEYVTDGYAVRPLDGFAMHAHPGELIALLGPSGSGKTTLLSTLSGMLPDAQGSVVVDGIDVLGLSDRALEQYRRSTIGIVFQGFNLIASLTARENVATPLLVAGSSRRDALRQADALLEEVGLADRRDHRPHNLSGGQQQRVAVARGLIGDPLVLLADEPTANLDLISAEQVISLFRRLRDAGRTIIISTHDDRLIPAVDRSVVMGGAPLAMEGASLDTPAERRVQLNAGDVLFRQGDVSDHVYVVETGTVEVIRELAGGGRELLATVDAGSYVGELGPLLGFPRSATIAARTAAELTAYTVDEFRNLDIHGQATP